MNDRAHFVLGTGRCGSTLLSSMLRLHPRILSISEFFTLLGPRVFSASSSHAVQLWDLLSRTDADIDALLRAAVVPELLRQPRSVVGLAGERALSPLELVTLPHLTNAPELLLLEIQREVADYPPAPIGRHLQRLFEWLKCRFERQAWIERSGGSIEYAEWLRAQWPDARFIHLVRDGRECAYSMSRHPFFRVRLGRLLERDSRLSPVECLTRALSVARFGTYWSAGMLKAQRLLAASSGGDQLILHYDELVESPEATLRRLADFIGVAADATWLRAAAALSVPSACSGWRTLDADEQARLERACRPGMRVLDDLRHRR